MSGTRVDVCGVDDIDTEDLIRFDHGDRTYALYRTADDGYLDTDVPSVEVRGSRLWLRTD